MGGFITVPGGPKCRTADIGSTAVERGALVVKGHDGAVLLHMKLPNDVMARAFEAEFQRHVDAFRDGRAQGATTSVIGGLLRD